MDGAHRDRDAQARVRHGDRQGQRLAEEGRRRIARGDVIAEIETDKSTVEMEATASGTLAEIVHDAGAEVAVGEPIAWLEDGS